jgi:hypothetical protein
VSEGFGAHALSHSEDSNSNPSAIPPKDRLMRPPAQDDQAHATKSDNRPAESGKKRENKSLVSGSNIVAACSLLVAALSLILSLNQSSRAEVSRQRDQIIDYTGKIAALAADNSG